MFIPTTTLTQGGPLKAFDSTLGADATAIDSGAVIPGSYDVLHCWFYGRTTEAVDRSTVLVRVNNDSNTNYDRQAIRGQNVTASSFQALAGTSWVLTVPGANQQAGVAGTIQLTMPGYAQTTFHKCGDLLVGCTDDTAANLSIDCLGMRWKDTSAVTRISVTAGSGNLLAGSRLLVYVQ